MLTIRAKNIILPFSEMDEEELQGSTVPKLLEFWSAMHLSCIPGHKKIYGDHDKVRVIYGEKTWIFANVKIALANPSIEGKYNCYTMIFGEMMAEK